MKSRKLLIKIGVICGLTTFSFCFNTEAKTYASIVQVQSVVNKLSADSDSIYVGQTVKFTLNPGDGKDQLYQFNVYNYQTGDWKIVTDYKIDPSFSYQFAQSGKYQVLAFIKNKNSTNRYDSYSKQEVVVNPPVIKINNFIQGIANPTTWQSIDYKVDANGNDLLYQFHVYNYQTGNWKILTNYRSSPNLNYVFSEPGKYQILAFIKNKYSNNRYDLCSKIDTVVGNATMNLNSVTPSDLNPMIWHQSSYKVDLQGSNLLYQFNIYNYQTGDWKIATDYKVDPNLNYQFPQPGKYQILAFAKNRDSSNRYDLYSKLEVEAKGINLLGVSVDSVKPVIGQELNFKISSDIQSNEILYQYNIYNYQSKSWYVVSDYKSDPNLKWKFTQPGDYQVLAFAKNNKSPNRYDSYTRLNLHVDNIAISNMDMDTSDPIVGKAINFKTDTEANDVLYQYHIYNYQTGDWKIATDYKTDPNFNWTFLEPGKYQILGFVKNKNSTNRYDAYINKNINVRIGEIKLKSLIDNDSTILAGKATTFKMDAEGGKNLVYQYNIYDYAKKTWKVLSDYTSNPYGKITFDNIGKYQVLGFVKDTSSSNRYDSYLKYEVTASAQDVRVDETNLDSSINFELGQVVNFNSLPLVLNNKVFQFNIYDYVMGNWSRLTEYNNNNSIQYTFNRSGRYQILCFIKDKDSTSNYDSYGRININVTTNNISQEPNAVYEKCNLTLDEMVDVQNNLNSIPVVYWNETNQSRATKEQIRYYCNPQNFLSATGKLQFLILNYAKGITADELNEVLMGKGILQGKGATFLTAAENNNINLIYLVSHALLETGNGTTVLANGGLKINDAYAYGMPVYNMFGIGAYDKTANASGTKFAKDHGWYTPEAAILGGAEYIATNYLNSNQDTLFEMRWNPRFPGQHQYATDIGWAYKQTSMMKRILDYTPNAKLIYSYPLYK